MKADRARGDPWFFILLAPLSPQFRTEYKEEGEGRKLHKEVLSSAAGPFWNHVAIPPLGLSPPT